MIDRIFQRFQRLNIPIILSGRQDVDKFIQWGKLYSSYNESYTTMPEVIINIPTHPVCITGYYFKTVKNATFPTKWKVLGSFDQNEWYEISSKDEYMCTDSFEYSPSDPKHWCNVEETRYFEVSSECATFYYYIKFAMEKNSFWNEEREPYLCNLNSRGFDIKGSYMIQYMKNTCEKCLNIKKFFINLIIITIIK